MNKNLEHQKLVNELNRRRENHLMREMEERSTPFFWAILIVIAAITLWGIL